MIKSKDILNEAMSDAEIKKMHKKYKETGELPPHLKKMLKGKKDFEKKFKVKNIVVPGLEWMADIDEAQTASIDGEKLMNFLMKRFKMSKKKAIDTMKKHKMDTSFIKEAIEPSGIMAKINKIVQSKQAAKIDGVLMDMFSASIMMRIFNAVNDKSKKDMNKGTMRQVKVILHKVMKQNKVRESVNEESTPNDLMKELEKVNKIVIKILKKNEMSPFYIPAVIQKWMSGLHSDIRKQGYKV